MKHTCGKRLKFAVIISINIFCVSDKSSVIVFHASFFTFLLIFFPLFFRLYNFLCNLIIFWRIRFIYTLVFLAEHFFFIFLSSSFSISSSVFIFSVISTASSPIFIFSVIPVSSIFSLISMHDLHLVYKI